MPEIDRLSPGHLDTLERLLADEGAPVVRLLNPPASDEEIAALESFLGRSLPQELRCWWEWHDGVDASVNRPGLQRTLGPLFHLEATAKAIESTRTRREIAAEVSPEDPNSQWRPSWVSIANLGDLVCDCGVGVDDPVPVLDGDPHHSMPPGRPAARSLGEMVRWWVEALEVGAWSYEQDAGRWERRYDLVPPERDQVGLV